MVATYFSLISMAIIATACAGSHPEGSVPPPPIETAIGHTARTQAVAQMPGTWVQASSAPFTITEPQTGATITVETLVSTQALREDVDGLRDGIIAAGYACSEPTVDEGWHGQQSMRVACKSGMSRIAVAVAHAAHAERSDSAGYAADDFEPKPRMAVHFVGNWDRDNNAGLGQHFDFMVDSLSFGPREDD